MSELYFEWDPTKNASNEKKHRISFDEAKTVFSDDFARLIADPDHSKEEERFILLGSSIESNLLIVCHCIRDEDTVRIISARKADKKNEKSMRTFVMRDNYDFTDSVKNPYTKKLKKQVTIRLDEDTISYFKELAEDKGLPYQSLINLYLRDCAQSHRDLKWQ
jgi:uncharacterized DUF497 family protein